MFARQTRRFVGIHGTRGTSMLKIATSTGQMRQIMRQMTGHTVVEMKPRRSRQAR